MFKSPLLYTSCAKNISHYMVHQFPGLSCTEASDFRNVSYEISVIRDIFTVVIKKHYA